MIRHMSKKIDIIGLYLKDRMFNGREIAKLLKINPQSALNHLNELVKLKILKVKVRGRNKEYSLFLDNVMTVNMLDIAEKYRAIKAFENKELKILVTDLLEFCETIVLFGSFASGKFHSDSDIDLVIIGGKKSEILKIKRNFPREVNIEFLSFASFRKAFIEKKALAIEIMNNHVLFGETYRITSLFQRGMTA